MAARIAQLSALAVALAIAVLVTPRGSESVPVTARATGAGGADPSFAPGGPIPVGHLPFSIATADLNGDGKPDLAVANRHSNNVTVLLGNGAGGFSAAPGSPVEVGGEPFSVVTADFNGDGRPDLAAGNADK